MINSRKVFTFALGTLFSSTILSLSNSNILAENQIKDQNNQSQEQIYSGSENLIALENTVTQISYRKGGSNSNIPYTITPRYTLISSNKPTFRWNKVDGASQYLVKLQGEGINWQTEVKGTKVVYSGKQPLESGIDYIFTVETNTGVSSLDDEGGKLGFKLLTPEQMKRLEKVNNDINQSNLTASEKAIAIAKSYKNLNLKAEAIEKLEQLKAEGNANSKVYYLLGDIYAETGLNLLAEENYIKAIELESASNNLEGVTDIQASLVGVKIMLGKFNEAEELVKEAQAGYTRLGDAQKGQELNSTLIALKEGKNNVIRNTIGTRGSSQQNTSAQEEIDKVITPNQCPIPGMC